MYAGDCSPTHTLIAGRCCLGTTLPVVPRDAPGSPVASQRVSAMPKAKGKSRRHKYSYNLNRKRLYRSARRRAAPRIAW